MSASIWTPDSDNINISELPFITEFNDIVADGTDQTSAIVAWLGTLSSTLEKLYVIPWNCQFDYNAVIAAIPEGVLFLDLSGLNGFSGINDTGKRIGILSKDSAGSDSGWQIVSGHLPQLHLVNTGDAGTTSASKRIMGIVFDAGFYSTGTKGYREAAGILMQQSTGNPYWEINIRKYAPWLAMAANWERWAAGVAAVSGTTWVVHLDNFYVAASSGTTGNTAPVHTSGTVSDGGVNWTFVCTREETLYAFDQYGRTRVNGGISATALLSIVMRSDDTASSLTVEMGATGASKPVVLAGYPTNAAGTRLDRPTLKWSETLELDIRAALDAKSLARFSTTEGAMFNKICHNSTAKASLATTMDVSNVGTIIFDDAGATNFTGFTGGTSNGDQYVECIFLTANTTLVDSANFRLQGTANVTPTVGSMMRFYKLPDFYSANKWYEASRSIK